jgi:biotin carboxyl carrier protein
MKWWVERDGRRLDISVQRLGERFELALDGTRWNVELRPLGEGLAALLCEDGRTFAVANQPRGPGHWRISFGPNEFDVSLRDPLERDVQHATRREGGANEVRAPIPGRVVSTMVRPGDEVAAGTTLLILEAMKMENQIVAESAGLIREVLATPGTTVESGQLLVVMA